MAKTGIDTVRSADLWECPVCSCQVMTGWAREEMIVSQKALQSPLVLVDLTNGG